MHTIWQFKKIRRKNVHVPINLLLVTMKRIHIIHFGYLKFVNLVFNHVNAKVNILQH